MITANEARILAQEYLDINTNIELGIIEEQIRNAVDAGRFYISSDGSLSLYCKGKLESMGYKVETGTQYNEPWYCIKW